MGDVTRVLLGRTLEPDGADPVGNASAKLLLVVGGVGRGGAVLAIGGACTGALLLAVGATVLELELGPACCSPRAVDGPATFSALRSSLAQGDLDRERERLGGERQLFQYCLDRSSVGLCPPLPRPDVSVKLSLGRACLCLVGSKSRHS